MRTALSPSAPTIAIVNPSTFAVTKVEVKGAFLRLLLSQIERGRPAGQLGYIATEDVAVDSGATDTVQAPTDTLARARSATVSPNRPPRTAPVVPAVPNRAARDRGDLAIVPTQVRPTAQESWSDFRARLGKADIRGTPGRMPRQSYCDYGASQQVP